jgi:TetR/AcrR family transcriptional repressor of nem operon
MENLLRKLAREDPAALASSVVAEMVGALTLSRAILDKKQSDAILLASRDIIRARISLDRYG